MSLANSCALLLLFFLTLSLFITCSTAANTIGVTHTTVAVAADNVPLPKKVATFLPSDISPPTEKYWCSRLPNTPLPKALRYLLQPGHYPSINREFANENVSAAVILRTYRIRYRISYKRDDKKSLNAALPDSTIFYQYDDLHPGKKMKVLFTESGTKVSFLPRQVAESIPFSSDKLPEILKYFKLEVNSKEAQVIREEIGGCEEPNMEGEEKYCKKQEYTVSAAVRMIGDHKAAVCHKMRYPYAVHYCHVIADTEVDEVALVGADGTKVKAVTVCHLNTSAWSPDHMAFQVLKIKPGPAVCHFLDNEIPIRSALMPFIRNKKIHEVPTSMVADVAKVKAATVCPSNHQRLKFSKLIQDREFYIFVVTDSLFRVPTKDQEKTP
ncbi:hypothetical protein POTOM_057813 [Populus tomentosa]|uniref:BURP domain-containing protein n=1 Tax=Populus tomentosa TaxID=118781 RepID=A0A8X7Y2Z2_POPTO|nr:hypothetical protein POTOM_057813 [Populus tomentosa]